MNGRITLHKGDCLDVIRTLDDCSIDSVCTDPPYALTANKRGGTGAASLNLKSPAGRARVTTGFMGKAWDTGETAFAVEFWAEVWRVLKPGGHVAAFGGTRSYHRLACAIEDAGFEIRDQLAWCYGTGFPKSHDVSKQLDKAAGAEREITGPNPTYRKDQIDAPSFTLQRNPNLTAPATDAARQWEGWGTALKPALEIITLGQKPFDLVNLCGIVAHKLVEAACQLPLCVKDAESNSSSSPSVFVEGFGSVQWRAVSACNTRDDLFALMATLPSGLALPSSLSTALSWLDILGAVLSLGSTFTTETKSSLTTDLKTLNSLLSLNTPRTTAEELIRASGTKQSASLVARLFSAVSDRLDFTLQLTALDPATDHLDELSPKFDFACLARKPLSERTVAANVLRWGTGAINVDGCRVGVDSDDANHRKPSVEYKNGIALPTGNSKGRPVDNLSLLGRFPANLCHDGSHEVLAAFPDGDARGGHPREKSEIEYDGWGSITSGGPKVVRNDSGSAARFYYSAKASKADRALSKHPTVKPVKLMQWLVRLITPPGGTTLDPFAGSGTTGQAAYLEGFRAVLIEREPEYQADIERRIANLEPQFETTRLREDAALQPRLPSALDGCVPAQ